MNPPDNSVATLNSARRKASRLRAEWLMFVGEGMMGVSDLLNATAQAENSPLLKLSLRQVLMAQPGWGRKRAADVINHVMLVSGAKINSRKLTVGWLLDSRAGGRRFAAWLDASEVKTTPWPGFPYTRSSVVRLHP